VQEKKQKQTCHGRDKPGDDKERGSQQLILCARLAPISWGFWCAGKDFETIFWRFYGAVIFDVRLDPDNQRLHKRSVIWPVWISAKPITPEPWSQWLEAPDAAAKLKSA
jgi:hypothetical protein